MRDPEAPRSDPCLDDAVSKPSVVRTWSEAIRIWLVDTGKPFALPGSGDVKILEFQHSDDEDVLDDWARHFRGHYCDDADIDNLRRGTGHTRAQYLTELIFPSRKGLGPSIRAGDFAEILVADYLEFVLDYWVPRTRYAVKTIRNESTKGADVLAFRFEGRVSESEQDELAIWESKAGLSDRRSSDKLQKAVDDSAKDRLRRAESLNALKRRLLSGSRSADATRVERFQNPEDRPYRESFGAAALLPTAAVDVEVVKETDVSKHPGRECLELVIIRGNGLMKLVHALYQRAADGA